MQIVVIGPGLKMGGIERSSVNIANIFDESGHKLTYIAMFKQNRFFKLNPSINFIEPPNNINAKNLELIKSILWFRKLLCRINPDSVLAFNYFYAAIVRLALVGTKIPCYVSDRASPLYKWQKHVFFFNYIVFKLFPPTGVIAQTKIAADYKNRFFGSNTQIKIIPNALRYVTLYPEMRRKKQVLAVGRLNDHLKGFDRLIKAFAKIENSDWQLVFAGGDAESGYLKKLATELGIIQKIDFLGEVIDIDRIYAEAGIFVIPSRSEGYPNALCEAMAAGLPCLAFDFIAGPRDIITDGVDGYIVENGNIDALAERIDYLVNHEDERIKLGTNALKIRDRLHIDKIGAEYIDFILHKN